MATTTVKIGSEERSLDTADEQWINQQINKRRADGEQVCVRVQIVAEGVNVSLSTPTCGGGRGGGRGRRPNANEQRIVDLWRERGLTAPNFTGGSLVAFLKQLRRSI